MFESTHTEVRSPDTSVRGARPPRPEGLRQVDLSENARTVLTKRYLRRGPDGSPIESIEDMFWRVAWHVAEAENEWGGDVLAVALQFYDLLASKSFFPNSPTFTGAGTPLGQLAACFVLPITDDMGRDSAGIFQTLRDAALIQQTGGGNGFSFSRLRQQGAVVKSSAGVATGPVGFLRVYDKAFGEVAQGGTRRGANMAVLRVDHPDIRQFITCKTDENQITNFNISVGVTDAFMQAVRDDGNYDLVAPHTGEVVETVRAREILDLIVRQAHHNGEPGMLFLDAANRANPVPHLYDLEATNPCGEQWLGPYENCCLGSINLAEHFAPGGGVDWEGLRQSTVLSTRFLDDVVTANAYVPAVPQLREAALRARRIGLGIMGLGDLMYHVGVRYGSQESLEFAAQVMEFVRFHCMQTSVELAADRGPFIAIRGSIYDPEDLHWVPPTPIEPYRADFGRPPLDWDVVVQGIRRHGIRNAAQTTIAPTGTIATVAGCESYGCEPVFALAYYRHVDDRGQDLRLTYTSPLFEQALIEAGVDEAERQTLVQQIMDKGSCQEVEGLPEEIRQVFVVSQDITAEEHVRIQAALQAFVDNSLSKTCNFPETASSEDVARAYLLAWELGCKGLTVYVTGSRQKVVLETKATAAKKGAALEAAPAQLPFWYEGKKPRPPRLDGCTYQTSTPLGKAFITINQNSEGQPFEVFITTAKAGSETAAVSEAIGRLISYVLRVASPVSPRERMAEVVRQLAGIGGGRPLGFGPNRVLSLPDGLARALAEYLGETPEAVPMDMGFPAASQLPMAIGDLCPECGSATLVAEEGCRKCYTCGYSEC
ncbi:MAG TPA: adenosylcobalamin-dependent ribonucleoside-diphosphate reductase [Anaerolineales bacterium]|nr:adenosylcobalamin-dependent ribonucleoside-diphosphate reductase [Anaerolineales bacterium]